MSFRITTFEKPDELPGRRETVMNKRQPRIRDAKTGKWRRLNANEDTSMKGVAWILKNRHRDDPDPHPNSPAENTRDTLCDLLEQFGFVDLTDEVEAYNNETPHKFVRWGSSFNGLPRQATIVTFQVKGYAPNQIGGELRTGAVVSVGPTGAVSILNEGTVIFGRKTANFLPETVIEKLGHQIGGTVKSWQKGEGYQYERNPIVGKGANDPFSTPRDIRYVGETYVGPDYVVPSPKKGR